MSAPSRPVPRVDHDSEAYSSNDPSQCSDSSEESQYYEKESYGEESYEGGEEVDGERDYASEDGSTDLSYSAEAPESSEEQARIQHRTCVVKEILTVKT